MTIVENDAVTEQSALDFVLLSATINRFSARFSNLLHNAPTLDPEQILIGYERVAVRDKENRMAT